MNWRKLVLTHSPYLASSLDLAELKQDPETALNNVISEAQTALAHATNSDYLMRILRVAKKKAGAIIAIADLGGIWNDVKVMTSLSAFADFCVLSALRHLLVEAHREGRIKISDKDVPEKNCGLSVIALGKWGAHELNYSSDIDLMVIFDPEISPVSKKEDIQNFYIRLTRDLARILDQPTENGYVFRTDLRLRPDPGAMPLAVSIETAEFYYGSLGQNWERAAMIKARAVAGDMRVAKSFNDLMQRWIWRKNLDFAAIQDIHSIKRQINARQKRQRDKSNPLLGFNVKLGHGGIREIEFFVQTQQLIYGGKDNSLRAPDTLTALSSLSQARHITDKICAELSAAYLYLRRIEHRLQMRDDLQTHSLPDNLADFRSFALFAGHDSTEEFMTDIQRHLKNVRLAYDALFNEGQNLSGNGSLVFTGVEDDPETLDTIKDMGFHAPEKITAGVRGWHHGRYRAMRSERARQLLTELIPHILHSLAQTPHPDDAFLRFDHFLSKLPSGVSIFSMFVHKPDLMPLVAKIMGSAPVLADYLGQHPDVLESVIDPSGFRNLPDLGTLEKELTRRLETIKAYEASLDIVRRFAKEKRFHAGVHLLLGLSSETTVARCLSDIAETCLLTLMKVVEKEFSRTHGTFKKGRLVVLALGGFGARQMYFDSDLDIVGLYLVDQKELESTGGAKPLPPNTYYIRLMQRLLTALSAPTAEGILYETDTRLRPAGMDGPLAISLEGFVEYYKKSAWTWEHMSLMRARPLSSDKQIAQKVQKHITAILSAPRDAQMLCKDVLDMRKKLTQQHGDKNIWDLKWTRGGLTDIMFIAQYLALKHGAVHPHLAHPCVQETLKRLRSEKLLSAKDYKTLTSTLAFLAKIQSFLRLTAELPFNPKTAAMGIKTALLCHIFPRNKKAVFSKLAAEIKKHQRESHRVFQAVFKKR